MGDLVSEVSMELFERQGEIIKIQAEAIEELYKLLLQHVEACELDEMSVTEKINEAARIRAENNL